MVKTMGEKKSCIRTRRWHQDWSRKKKSVLLRMRRDEVTARESRLQMDREATEDDAYGRNMRYSTRCWRLARTSWATAAPPFSTSLTFV